MLIFDLDGTLWETTRTTYLAANQVAKMYPEVKEISMDVIKKGMGLSSNENALNYMPYLEVSKGIEYLRKISEINFKLIGENGAHVYDGVCDSIKKLSSKYKLGIITNNYDEYVEMFFKCSGLKDYFCDYMGAATYKITKGEAIRRMVDRNNEPDSFYIGDIKKDMDSTYEAGIRFIHARYGFEPTLETEYFINDISDLEKLLDKIY